MDYVKKAKDVAKKIAQFGAPIHIKDITVTTDPFTGEPIVNPESDFNAKALRTDWSEKDLKNTSIKVTDSKVMIDAVSGVPRKNMTATFDGVTYNIVEVMPLSPAGVALLYYLALRV